MPTAIPPHLLFAARIEGVDIAHPTGACDVLSAGGGGVVRDNRVVMHRATPFARAKERRHMVRTTASCAFAIQ